MSDHKKPPRRPTSSRTSRSDPETEDFKATVVAYNDAVSQTRHPAGHATPAGVLAAQLPGFRNRQELTVVGLAERCAKLGAPYIDRNVITKIENNARGVSLVEAIVLAVALQVSPMHLFIPLEDEAFVSLAPHLKVQAPMARQWVRGQQPLPGTEDKAYRTEVPDSEWQERTARLTEAELSVVRIERRLRVLRVKVQLLADDLAEVEGYGWNPAAKVANSMDPRHQRLSSKLDLVYDQMAEEAVDLDDAQGQLLALRREIESTLPMDTLDATGTVTPPVADEDDG